MKTYEKFYKRGGFGYNKKRSISWLKKNTAIFSCPSDTTLLDAGCGDGFWSFLCGQHLNVTGVDLSKSGIKMARSKNKNKNITFKQCDVFEIKDRWDIVFCRAISILNLSTDDKEFKKNLKFLFSLCKKEMYYIVFSKSPYNRWVKSNLFDSSADKEWINSKWFYHDPSNLYNIASQIGKTTISQNGGYIICNIKH